MRKNTRFMDPKYNFSQNQSNSGVQNTSNNSTPTNSNQREAALSLVRNEINNLYKSKNQPALTNQGNIQNNESGILNISHNSDTATNNPTNNNSQNQYTTNSQPANQAYLQQLNAEQWKKYHSAWQTYYQKYYEQYYVNEIRKNLGAQKEQLRNRSLGNAATNIFAGQNNTDQSDDSSNSPKTEALNKIRRDIIAKAQHSAKKARKSRHFIPIAGMLTACIIGLLLQYNQFLIANVKAYVSPSESQPESIIIDPNADVPVGPENKMIIPKINVDAPIVLNVGSSAKQQLDAMSNGIAHVRYPGASALPGQIGNAVFSAHSSSDWSDSGAYKFIFVQLERLTNDDVIYINYNSKRYAYKVFDTKTVLPTETHVLNYKGNDPIITLITCTPLGTAQKRFLVFAKQISPDPSNAEKAQPTKISQTQTTAQMTGTRPTLIEQLFGAR